ncbi:hypothetical protein BN14_03663 [Rhizoctonia solani AG-1 IB]|uniref:Uncharacterized protein n=1 Tax=Thanatephorus cucumeris (strain AG1-IB / isolate 7/3/14) TaxID=1108050 RepID=M5BT57_THACB|nr:hypothetical protein BN14_03663 [Rhizoctonia solani AG-1 IB]
MRYLDPSQAGGLGDMVKSKGCDRDRVKAGETNKVKAGETSKVKAGEMSKAMDSRGIRKAGKEEAQWNSKAGLQGSSRVGANESNNPKPTHGLSSPTWAPGNKLENEDLHAPIKEFDPSSSLPQQFTLAALHLLVLLGLALSGRSNLLQGLGLSQSLLLVLKKKERPPEEGKTKKGEDG